MLRRAGRWLKRKLIGPPDRIPQRVITVGFVLALAIALGGAWLAFERGLETTSASSLTYLRPILQVATSTWVYVLVLMWLVRRILLKRNEQYADQAANITGYQPRSVRRLGYEARDPDGSTRVIATSEDEPEDIKERILAALTGDADDDTMSFNAAAVDESQSPESPASPEDALLAKGDTFAVNEARSEALMAVYRALDRRSKELHADLDSGTDDLLSAEFDTEKVVEAIQSDDDRFAPLDLIDDADQDLAATLDDKLAELDANEHLREDILRELDHVEDQLRADIEARETEATTSDTTDKGWLARLSRAGRRLGRGLLDTGKAAAITALATGLYHGLLLAADRAPIDVRMMVPETIRIASHDWRAYLVVALVAFAATLARMRSTDKADDDSDDDSLDPWREQYKLFRLDLASTLDFDRLLWQFAVPALVTVAGLLIVVRLWVQPWLYPALFAAGVIVGLLNYLRISWQRARRLDALRSDRQTVDWGDAAILVKEVDVPEARIQYAWLADRRYAHDDREEFAAAVAHRAYELVNGVEVSPSIMEKQATQLDQMQPDLHGFRDDEKERIMTWLLDRVEDAQHGLVPKAKLIEDCVEHDIHSRRFGPGRRGKGYDPDLVREAYRELVPAALVEQEIAFDEDADQSLRAVRHRRDPLPPEYGTIRAQFSSQFSNYARWDPLYDLPDVSDRLNADPVYADRLGYRPA